MGPAAILSALVTADTQQATVKLTKFSRQFDAIQGEARKGIEAKLGATLNPVGFDKYQERVAHAARVAKDREAFKAQLGANFSNTGFLAYERAIDKAIADTARLTRQQEEQAVKQRAAARKSLGNFFTGSKTGTGEERSFARGTLRGTVGRGAGFIGGGLAGGLLGYVSASGIKSSIEQTTQMVKQAQVLSQYTGMSVKSALELEAVSNAYGASSKSLGMGFRTLATQVNTALTKPTAASTEAFRQLGLSQDEVKAHSRDLGTLFGVVADKLNAMPAGAAKTAVAAKLLGRNWQQLGQLIQAGSQGMSDQMRQAQALGVTLGGSPLHNIAKLHEAEINLSLAQQGLSVQFTEHLAPALIKGATAFIKLAEGARRELAPAFKFLSPIVKDVGHWLQQNKGIVGALVVAFVGLKIVRTVGGWMIGLVNDGRKVFGFAKTLIMWLGRSAASFLGMGAEATVAATTVEAEMASTASAVVTANATIEASNVAAGASFAGLAASALAALGPIAAVGAAGYLLAKSGAGGPLRRGEAPVGYTPGTNTGGRAAGLTGAFSSLHYRGYYHGSSTSEQGIAGRNVRYSPGMAHHARHHHGRGGWNISTTHAAVKHMEWNPFTSTYQLMTSAHHSRLRDLYISEFGKAPSSGPSHAKGTPAQSMYWDPFSHSYQLMTSAQHTALRNRYIRQFGKAPSSGPSSTSAGSTAAGTQNAFQAPSQSASFQIAMQNIQNALQTAQNSNNVAGQQRLLGREIKLDRKAIGLDDRKLAQIARQLRGSISKAKRAQLMQDKLTVLQDLGQLRSDIGNAMSQLQSATSASAGTFDLAPAGASVTAPTIYDIRRAARGERHKLAEQHHHHSNNTFHIKVEHEKDVAKVADAIDRALGSGVHARLRAAGMRGT